MRFETYLFCGLHKQKKMSKHFKKVAKRNDLHALFEYNTMRKMSAIFPFNLQKVLIYAPPFHCLFFFFFFHSFLCSARNKVFAIIINTSKGSIIYSKEAPRLDSTCWHWYLEGYIL